MHDPFETYKYGHSHLVWGAARFSSWEKQEEGGGREKRKGGEEKRKEGKEKEKGRKRKEKGRRKEKKKGEEESKKKEEKLGVLRSEQTWTEKNPKLRYKR